MGEIFGVADRRRTGDVGSCRAGCRVRSGIRQATAGLGSRARQIVRIGDGRYTLEWPLEPPPDSLLGELAAGGAHLVSLNPIRQTLEDFFVAQVSTPEAQAPRSGLEIAS